MRVLIDTNVLFSAALNPNGTPFQAYVKAVTPPNTGIICRQKIEDLRRTFNRKLPHKIQALESVLAVSMLMLEVVPVPEAAYASEEQVRDVNDRPILRAAIHAKADVILTGDKDLLEADLKRPLFGRAQPERYAVSGIRQSGHAAEYRHHLSAEHRRTAQNV